LPGIPTGDLLLFKYSALIVYLAISVGRNTSLPGLIIAGQQSILIATDGKTLPGEYACLVNEAAWFINML